MHYAGRSKCGFGEKNRKHLIYKNAARLILLVTRGGNFRFGLYL